MSSAARITTSVLALLGATSCSLDSRAPLDLDAYEQGSELCVEVVHEALDLGGPILRVVADEGVDGGAWALVHRQDLDPPNLVLARVPPPGGEELETPLVELDLTPNYAPAIELRAGAKPGELWALVPSATGQTLLYLVPELGLLGQNGALSNFPLIDPTPPCPATYNRILMFAEGRPYVLAAPDCSPNAGLVLHLLELEPESLAFGVSWNLEFDPCFDAPDPTSCALASAYSVPIIQPPRTSLTVASQRTPIGLSMMRQLNQSDPRAEGGSLRDLHEVALLDVVIDEGGPNAGLLTLPGFAELWPLSVPVLLGPAQVGRDLYSTQLLVHNLAAVDDAVLMRFDTAIERYDLVRESLPFDGSGELVQLDGSSAILDIDRERGVLEAVELVDVDAWPRWSPVELIELEDLVDVEQAGVGKLLLRRENNAPQLISLSCP